MSMIVLIIKHYAAIILVLQYQHNSTHCDDFVVQILMV